MKRLVLLGGGHAHVHVLDRLAAERPGGVEVVLVSPHARQLYSGMVPGWIAGEYAIEACALPLAALAARAGVRFVQQAALRLDAGARCLWLADGSTLEWDVLSIDVGSVSRGAELPGAAGYALAVRPLEGFVARLDAALQAAAASPHGLAIVGGGAAAVELAFACAARLRGGGAKGPALQLLGAAARPLAGMPAIVQWRAAALLREQGIRWRGHSRVVAIDAQGVRLDCGSHLPAAQIILAAGAAAPRWLGEGGLATDAAGFVAVDACLQSLSHPGVFAAGDCAALPQGRPKSGVYAVRAGPPLAENLLRALRGAPLQAWSPQRRALYLIRHDDGAALGAWGALGWWGRWSGRWKRRIDCAFIARFGGG
ncbi:FAD-dependent oxidoreductase [Pseudothauera lacus]|uniref:FAD-dependent oxidoreductase n=1 Tax=Pseudothauera lacus TaxID=2136175 RepID=UPI0015E6A4B7|nr:FAD-dependent oxidoreductase [Pseudothauera lacus]